MRLRTVHNLLPGLLDFMRSTALARYPARVQLYEKVCSGLADNPCCPHRFEHVGGWGDDIIEANNPEKSDVPRIKD